MAWRLTVSFHNHRRFSLQRKVFYLAAAEKKKKKGVSFVFIAFKTVTVLGIFLEEAPKKNVKAGSSRVWGFQSIGHALCLFELSTGFPVEYFQSAPLVQTMVSLTLFSRLRSSKNGYGQQIVQIGMCVLPILSKCSDFIIPTMLLGEEGRDHYHPLFYPFWCFSWRKDEWTTQNVSCALRRAL